MTDYRVYSYRLAQDDTKICPSDTGTIKISFTVEDESETIVTTQLINLTIKKTLSSQVSNTPADTIDTIASQQNQNTADITDLKADMTLIDDNFAGKVDKTQTIAGINLQNNITDTELKTALAINNNDNTSDIDKPVSTAQAEAIAQAITDLKGGATTYDTLKKITDLIGVANGIAPLGADKQYPQYLYPLMLTIY